MLLATRIARTRELIVERQARPTMAGLGCSPADVMADLLADLFAYADVHGPGRFPLIIAASRLLDEAE